MYGQTKRIFGWCAILAAFILGVCILSACGKKPSVQAEPSTGGMYKLNHLELSFGEKDSFNLIRVSNQQSKYFSKTVIRVPVTIKNPGDEPRRLNVSYYTFYDPKGKKTDDISNEYMDQNEASWIGDIKPGETKNAFFYILYSADGTYSIELEKPGTDPVKVKIDIKKT